MSNISEEKQAIALLTSSVEHLMETCRGLLQASNIHSDTITALNLRVSALEESQRYTGNE